MAAEAQQSSGLLPPENLILIALNITGHNLWFPILALGLANTTRTILIYLGIADIGSLL